MTLSIAVYVSLAAILALLGWHAACRDKVRLANGEAPLPFYCWECMASVAVVTLIFALRVKTGTDHMMYLIQYIGVVKREVFSRPEGMEPGFQLITRAFAAARCHYTIYFGFWAALQAGLMYFALRKHKFLLPWFALVLILGPYFINWISFLRQWVVALGFLAMLPWIVDRKLLPYIVGVAVLAMFHYSAVLLLLFYFLPYDRMARTSRFTLLAIYVVCFVLGLYPVWLKALVPVLKGMSLFGYNRYDEMLAEVANGDFRFLTLGPLRLISIFAQLVCIWYFAEVARQRDTDRLLPVVFGLTLVGSCYEVLFINTIHFMIRPVDLVYPCMAVMLAYVFEHLYRSRRFVELALCLLPVISYLIINVVKVNLHPSPIGECVNYHFFFLK